MKSKLLILIFGILVCFILSFSEEKLVYVIPIKGIIDLGVAPFVKRGVSEAEKEKAQGVIVEIETFGGRVDAAVQIRDTLLATKLPTVAFVNKRAISAGALIALACKKIFMARGATIGAATPVQVAGTTTQPTSEKAVSYVRAEFKSTAEVNNHPVKIAEAMVDKDVAIKGIIKKGKLLTLTTQSAIKYKLCQGEVNTLEELLKKLNWEKSKICTLKVNWAEKVVRFLTHPIVSSMLLTLGFFGLIFELRTPGFGLPGIFGLVCLILFFWGHYIVGLAGWEELLMFALGAIFLLVEIVAIPGFGIVGILGIILMIASLVLSLISRRPQLPDFQHAFKVISSAFLLTLILFLLTLRFFTRLPLLNRLVLTTQEKVDEGYIVKRGESESFIGKEGIALTPLRPAGKAFVNNRKIDVVSEGEFIERSEAIIVKKIEGNKIIVKKKV
jgi:membrane-bound serine protease (ClpP class)